MNNQSHHFQIKHNRPASRPAQTPGNSAQNQVAEWPVVHIVEDDEAVRNALSLLMLSAGWQVETYGSAENYITHCPKRDNCCMVLDLQMPGMTGADLLEHMRSEGNDTPVIVITAHPDERMISRIRASGVRAILTKPFEDSHLLSEINKVLTPPIQ